MIGLGLGIWNISQVRGGSTGPNDLKYWADGLPFDGLSNSAAPTGGLKYWVDGLPAGFIP